MKTNFFRVKEKDEKKIIIEEERTRNPFLLFFKKHKNFIMLSLIMFFLCSLLVSTGVAFSLFQGSNDYDITYIEGDETIDSNNKPEIDDEEVKDELLGEIAREQGIVLLVKTIMSQQGDVIYYYTDGTAVVIRPSGKIYRISTNKKGGYGISESGKIDDSAKRILVTSTTSSLADGTVITYYSDGSAKVEYQNQNYFLRDSNNIKLHNGTSLVNLAPSGVAPVKEKKEVNNNKVIKFTDKTSLVIIDGKKYIVNKNTEVSIEGNTIKYSKSNSFSVVSEKKYKDGNIITHFQNGSSIITEQNGNITYVKKSGDLLIKNKELYEVLPNPTGFSNSRKTIRTPKGSKVTYFDNGSAIITQNDGVREYVEDSDDIIYDDNRNISSDPISSKQTVINKTPSDNLAYSFDNGKTQVIRNNGTSYITDTSKLDLKPLEEKEEEEEKPSHEEPNENPGEGIYISEAENIYNDFKNVEDTKFIIKNNNKTSRTLRITIEEVTDYSKYNTSRLEPRFVKFQATIGDEYVKASQLTKNTWVNSSGVTNYIIYEGTVNAKETKKIALSLYVDYAQLNNSHQNKGFIGTIRVYVDDNFIPDESA